MAIPESFPQKNKGQVRALGFDFGTARIGVAFGQSLTGTAQPVAVVRAADGIPDWNDLEALIAEWTPDLFIIGLPYNLDGSESELLLRAVKFGKRLNGRFHKPVYGMDERLSSKEAIDQVLNSQTKKSAKKRTTIDDIAAQIILENWFAELTLHFAKPATDQT
jgi:putative Holliday junction resolvase